MLKDGAIDSIELGEQLVDRRSVARHYRPAEDPGDWLNYVDEVREAGTEEPERPVVFARLLTAVIGAEAPIPVDAGLTDRVDWEVELAVTIGLTTEPFAGWRCRRCPGRFARSRNCRSTSARMPTRRSQYANRSIRVSHRVFDEDSHSPGLYERIDRADRHVRVGSDGQGPWPMGLASRTPWWAASS